MTQSANPYQSPSQATQTPEEAEYMRRAKRPATPMVVGILCLVLSAFGVFGLAMSWTGIGPQADAAALEQQRVLMAAMGYPPL